MGCDIHIAVEVKNGEGVWRDVSLYRINPYYDINDEDQGSKFDLVSPYNRRDYTLFSALCGVRGRGRGVGISAPRGLPSDVSESVKREFDSWGDDCHSANFNTLWELESQHDVKFEGLIEDIHTYLNIEWWNNPKSGDTRIVYWFDS